MFDFKDQNKNGVFMKREERYERHVYRVSETMEFGAGSVLKNIFVFGSCSE